MCETAVEYAPDYQSFWTVSRKDNIVLCVLLILWVILNIDLQLNRSYTLFAYRDNVAFCVQ